MVMISRANQEEAREVAASQVEPQEAGHRIPHQKVEVQEAAQTCRHWGMRSLQGHPVLAVPGHQGTTADHHTMGCILHQIHPGAVQEGAQTMSRCLDCDGVRDGGVDCQSVGHCSSSMPRPTQRPESMALKVLKGRA